jgi:hypothetical protein
MTLLTENCPWQTLMDGPYDRWRKHNEDLWVKLEAEKITHKQYRGQRWSFGDMVRNCETDAERAACVLGKLNQQIENGGVIQWVDNRYAFESYPWLQEHLEGTGPVGKQIWEMLNPFLQDFMDEDSGEIRQCEDGDSAWEEAFGCSDRLSDKFYELEDSWHPEVYAYLEKLK